jgi:hypothetical protein
MYPTIDKAERLITKDANQGSQLVVFLDTLVVGYPRGNAFRHKSAMGHKNYRKKLKTLLEFLIFQMVQVDELVFFINEHVHFDERLRAWMTCVSFDQSTWLK